MSFFTDWLKGLDDKMRKQKRRIILFIDQCPAHPPDTNILRNATVKFFPANCTSRLQPQDLGVIKSLKQHYRKLLVKTADVNLIENAESDHFVPPENWSNLSDVTAFEEFVQCDSELAAYSLLTIDEIITNEETRSEEEDNCFEKPLSSFQQALTGFNTMQEYLISSDLNDKVKMALLTVQNEIFSVHSKNALQPKITKYIL
ncbi:hypothetical protein AVEN_250533-1 [Araneus ventricosus]|uniref:DDE-1 domain-containing protein n=1 Tax=Araneus ventricosus TaxID=182803 RepID=A0A4Y2FVZ3_ARAVE|nr:hypothetical protein AVEN_250533-1 [Araneus ventricosus]